MPSATMKVQEIRSVWTSDEGSMAQQTAKTRWAKIIQGTVDDIGKTATKENIDARERAESIAIQIALKQIKKEIEMNHALTPLQDDGKPDIQEWNDQLAVIGESSWVNCPWLFGECYMYRRIQRILTSSKYWQNYDVFKRQKDSTFVKSRSAVEELASRYMQTVAETGLVQNESKEEAKKLLFIEMTEVALWGNATDLSLLANLSLEDLQKLQGRDAIQKSQRNIVDNDTDDVWSYLQCTTGQPDRQIDIILDNAGFELFTDVLYAAYLLDTGIATTVRLHTKQSPWFVSDVIPSDIESMFKHLESSDCFPDRQYLDKLTPRLRKLFNSAAIMTTSDPFWTTPFSFHEMPSKAAALFGELQKSYLVIFKGDLNYRKLTRDGLWPHTTTFEEALGPLGKQSGIKILALRTNKSDVCVGVPTQREVDALNEEAPGGAWIQNGKYAVVSFNEGK
ncbi:uncharacterized protein N7477_007622 [Penicillium maclennaniae]|uniref:uncharacterized protein n=1 Tax=Penicillium maclennaniae TaxID=1343394 RepID=UPI002540A967|nr:uncharacterized protein N7477_007622 [Penicillium maclennaniae]KAJ5665174.1 hypothetical protein N7477_007622 [Penicillium maclennaniae]